VDTDTNEYSAFALAALRLFPRSIRNSLLLNRDFRNSHGIKRDVQITFHNGGVSFRRSDLFGSIRAAYAPSGTKQVVKDINGKEWQVTIVKMDNLLDFNLTDGERQISLPDFSALSPALAERLSGLERTLDRVNLPKIVVDQWRKILSLRVLDDDELDELQADLKETPELVTAVAGIELGRGTSRLSSLVPRSERYYARLAGDCDESSNITDYASLNAPAHINGLMSRRPHDGFLFALLLSSHSLIPHIIKTEDLKEEDLIRAYAWLQESGDRISQIGAIEIGLSILDKQAKIEPFITNLIEQIRDDNPGDAGGRLKLASSLIVLVDGELSRTRILERKPPFWRRLASIAQASLLERVVLSLQVDNSSFAEWALDSRLQRFYLQTMSDLRREPRWYPDYVFPQQLKAEFVGRIITAAQVHDSKIQSPGLRDLLFGEGPASLRSLVKFPFAYLPGPLEGGIESQIVPPADLVKEIEERLSSDVLEPKSFAALVNPALIFRLDSYHAQLAAKALRSAKHQLKKADDKEELFSVLRGLATVAAVTRSSELADEIRILVRRCRYELGHLLSAEDAMWIVLVAAASHADLMKWCEFVGQCLSEYAFQSIKHDEAERLHSHIEQLCHIEPQLWCTCGRAEAALKSLLH
jgi:hypothetical protein